MPTVSVATTEKVTAVFCVAVVGVILPTVGAVVSDEDEEDALIVIVVVVPVPIFPAASEHFT